MVVRDADGDVQNGAQVTLRQPGTSTPITQAIYDAVSGGGTLSNPLTANAKGEVEGYLPLPERFDAYVSSPTSLFTAYTVPNEGTGPDPSWYTGQWYDVTLPWGGTAGAQGDATGVTGGGTDDTAAIQAAIDTAGAAGGGIVYFPPGRYRITSRLDVPYANVHLVGQGQVHFVQTGSVVLGKSSVLVDFTARPAILFGGADTVSAGAGCSISDIQVAIPSGVAPAGTIYAGGTTYATVLFDRCGYQSGSGDTAVVTGRCWVKSVRFYDNSINSVSVQNGTPNTPKGSGSLWVEDCEGYSGLDFMRVYGGGYLFVTRNFIEQNPTRHTGTFVHFLGAMGAGAPDGVTIAHNFSELFDAFIYDEHSSGSLAGGSVYKNRIDRAGNYGMFFRPTGGALNAWNVWWNEIKGDPSNPVTGSIGIFVGNDNGADVTVFSAAGNEIATFGTHGILLATPTNADDFQDISFVLNRIHDISRDSSGNTDGIALAGAVSGYVEILLNSVHKIGSGAAPRYGVSVQAGATNLVVGFNVCTDAATAVVLKGTAHNGTTVIYRNNIGPVAAGDALSGPILALGPFHYTNLAAGASDQIGAIPGTDPNAFIPAPYNGRVLGFTVSATANIAGATLTIKGGIGATLSVTTRALAITAAAATDKGVLLDYTTAGDTFSQGDKLGVRATFPAGATTNDVTVYLLVEPT